MLTPRQVRRESWEWRPSGRVTYLVCNACGWLLMGCEDPACGLHHIGYYCDYGSPCPISDIAHDSDDYTEVSYDSYDDAVEEADSYQFYVDVMLSYYGIDKRSLADRAERTAEDARDNAALCRRYGLDARAIVYDPMDRCDRYDSYVMVFDGGESDFFVKLEMVKVDAGLYGEFLHRVKTSRAPSILDKIAWSLRDGAEVLQEASAGAA